MKVLFVSSGNLIDGINIIVQRQGESLKNNKIDIHYYAIKGKGFWGYLKNFSALRKEIKRVNPDLIHAHYSLSGFLVSISSRKPLIVSLMGSDLKSKGFFTFLTNLFSSIFWKSTIVKTKQMKKLLWNKNAAIIPNGVSLEAFNQINKKEIQAQLEWDDNCKHILFAANPKRTEKNYLLLERAIQKLNDYNITVHTLTNISPNEIPKLMNASEVIVLTSIREGSPNVVKEAMACCRPLVSTKVGDISWIFGNTKGCFLSTFNEDDLAQNIVEALKFEDTNGKTSGRSRIIELGLDSNTIANKIIDIYNQTNAKRR